MPDVLIQKIGNMKKDVEDIFATFPISLSGKKVLIKPNLLSGSPPEKGVTTSPALISAIVSRVQEETEDVIVGDNPGGNKVDVEAMAKKSGLWDASCGRFKVFSDPRPVPVKSKYVETVLVSREILDADLIINVPRAKTHALTRMTCCIKNMFGIVPGGLKPTLHTIAPSYLKFSELMVDIYSIAPPALNIVDAITVMEGMGPSNGSLQEYGRLISGRNGVSVDAVVAHIMGLDPSDVAMLSISERRGLGETEMGRLKMEGEPERIPDFSVPSTMTSSFLSRFNPFWDITVEKPFIMIEECKKCLECVDVCPTGAMHNADGIPLLEKEKCKSCFCCLELCKHGAISIPKTRIGMLERIKNIIFDRI